MLSEDDLVAAGSLRELTMGTRKKLTVTRGGSVVPLVVHRRGVDA